MERTSSRSSLRREEDRLSWFPTEEVPENQPFIILGGCRYGVQKVRMGNSANGKAGLYHGLIFRTIETDSTEGTFVAEDSELKLKELGKL